MGDKKNMNKLEADLKKMTMGLEKFGSMLGEAAQDDTLGNVLKRGLPSEAAQMERIEVLAEAQLQKDYHDIISGSLVVPVTYTDPDQTPLSGVPAAVLRNKWASSWDYLPHVPLFQFSPWLLAIYLGNYGDFMNQVTSLSETELKRQLARRETMFQVGAIFHVIIGARSLYPGSPVLEETVKVHGRVELNNIQIFEKLLELGVEVKVHDVAGYTPLHHCLTTHGNPITFKMAEVLLNNGADPNAVNRFGATPLTECVIANNHDFIRLLIKNGADPHVKDNDGVSAHDCGRHFPSINLLLKKADKKIIKEKRVEAKAVDNFKKCSVCLASTSTKCSGCSLEWYCSPKCLKADWKTHKPICFERRTQYIQVPFLDFYSTGLSFVSGQKSSQEKGQEIKETAPPSCIVKVQVLSLGEPMKVYNKDRSIDGLISSNSSKGAILLFNTVKTQGFQGAKGYFNATVKDKKMSVHPAIVPPETW